MKRVFHLLMIALAANLARADGERTWHVAPPPLGSDAHDGDASTPFATLDRARRAVRLWLAAHEQRDDLVVELHAGSYELAAPVRFDPADSGKNGFAVIYRAAPGEHVILSGGRRVAEWTREPDGTFRAEVGRDVDFRQLWIGDRRAIRARTPNVGLTFKFPAEKQSNGFDLPRAHLTAVALRPDEVELSVLIAWMHKRLRIARVTESADPSLVRAVIAAPEWNAVTQQPQGDRVYRGRDYWLENAREFLDAPGEFFLDRRTGTLFYRPRPDENLSAATTHVVRPELENLIVLEGRLDAPVHDLRFEGLTFAHTGWTRPNRFGFVDVQANSLIPADPAAAVDESFRHQQRKDRVPAAFQATASERVSVQRCRFLHLGGTGLMLAAGCQDNRIQGNSFYDLAGGGIEIGDDAVRSSDPRWFPRGNQIVDNFIAHIGEDYYGSVAILGYYTDRSLIAHNEIAGVPYTAISQGWGWGNPPAPPESRANRILGNRITNVMRLVDDGGGIYTTDAQPGSEIAGNVIARVLPPDPHTKAGGALYLDQFTSGFNVHDNVVAEANRWLYIWNPNIHDNRVTANFADTAAQRNDGRDNIVEPPTIVLGRRWPAAAQAIIASAGLEPAFVGARTFSEAREFVIESTSVDFQIISGDWRTDDAPRDSYNATCRASIDSIAAARWLPILPRAGVYDVDVWVSGGSAAANYTILHGTDENQVSLPATETAAAGGWHTIGHYSFPAGIGAEIKISASRSAGAKPLRAEAVRLTRTGGN